MELIGNSMSTKKLDEIAAIEKAIAEKYGKEAVQNPRSNWDEEKEKEYLFQMKEMYSKMRTNEGLTETLRSCPVCGSFPRRSMDDVCLIKFDCCNKCYVKYVENREERWLKGWRPNN